MADIQGIHIVLTSKICSHCRQEKPLTEFRKGSGKGHKKNYCKPCDNMKSHQNYEKNKERRRKQIKEWNEKNRKKLSKYAKESVECNTNIQL
jgi:hypothetical protein